MKPVAESKIDNTLLYDFRLHPEKSNCEQTTVCGNYKGEEEMKKLFVLLTAVLLLVSATAGFA